MAKTGQRALVTDGTPGRKNSVTSSNIAPLILAVQHFPLVPKSTESVRVTARILDEITNGISAFVFYRLDGSHRICIDWDVR